MTRLLLLAALFSFTAQAGDPVTVSSGDTRTAVVELFTSEGCSSCPPADRWLAKLIELPRDELDVLALSFHVDYWDYLGWKDRFSSAEYTRRQRQLGANNLQHTIYTPEFFVNGMEARGAGNIMEKIRATNERQAPVALTMTVSGDAKVLVVELQSTRDRSAIGQPQHRYLVYENNLSTDVERGENSGETLRHQQVVRYMSREQNLQASNRHRIEIDPAWNPRNVGVAVVVTSPSDRQYFQALHTPVTSLLTNRQ